jgi:hypothetical protein
MGLPVGLALASSLRSLAQIKDSILAVHGVVAFLVVDHFHELADGGESLGQVAILVANEGQASRYLVGFDLPKCGHAR